MLWSFCIVWHFYFEPGIVLVNFCMVWKHPYFKHMLKMSFNPTDVIFWKSNKMYSFQMDVGFLPVDPCLQCHMVSVTLMILFSWDMTLCERVIRLQLSEVMYCPFLSGSWGTYVSHKLVCVCDLQDLLCSLLDYPIVFVRTATNKWIKLSYRSEYSKINDKEAYIMFRVSAQKSEYKCKIQIWYPCYAFRIHNHIRNIYSFIMCKY